MGLINYNVGNSKYLKEIFESQNYPKPNLIITSPPYYDLLNYNNNSEQIGYGQSRYEDFLIDITKILQDCFEISDDNCSLWLIVDTFKKQGELKTLPFDIINCLKSQNGKTWILKEIIIWDKEKNLPWNSKGGLKNQFEYILFFTKGDNFKYNIDRVREVTDLKKWWKTYPERYNPNGKAPSNIWNFITPIRGWGHNSLNHLCPFPFALVEKIVSISSDVNDVIFDPFAGSGTVLAVSSLMNRDSIGIDINEAYKELFETQVINAAKKYWSNRLVELEETKNFIPTFKSLNEKLRKLKVASHVSLHINKINEEKFFFFAKDTETIEVIELYILENGHTPKTDLNNTQLLDLIKKSKIDIKIFSLKNYDFYDKFRNTIFYKYKFDKFYSYSSSGKIQSINKDETKYEYLYSDINIKIN